MAVVRIPHQFSRDDVRARMADRVDDLTRLLPGGMGQVATEWLDADRLRIAISAMGQRAEGVAEIEDDALAIHFDVPAHLAHARPMIEGVIRQAGDKLLGND